MTDTNTVAATATPKTAKLSPLQAMKADYNKHKAVIATDTETANIFGQFLGEFKNEDLQDWASAAPKSFSGYGLIQPKSGKPRLIGIPDKATVLADSAFQEWSYQRYLRRLVSQARGDDAQPSQFISVSGPIGQLYDESAFDFQAAQWVSYLNKQGLESCKKTSLEKALKDAAMATALFPDVLQPSWVALIKKMSAHATEKGKDTSIFTHWLATRDLKKAVRETITFDFEDEFEGDETDETDETGSEATISQ